MRSFLVTALLAFLFYLLLVAGSGSILFWSAEEIIAGIIIAIGTGMIARRILCRNGDFRIVDPVRLLLLALYIPGPFFVELTKANLDVAYRVITGNIRPGIIRLKSGMKSDFALLMLANSITLTPGTLTVDVDEKTNDLFIHVINIDEETQRKTSLEAEEIFSYMDLPKWIRRIAE
ncbi:MAG TPA: Na+/H+ antiporter subunit E [Methanospirillum sp.]|nr:Na+/H+ antiporter subunit E [Methanospirillum sp.]